MTQKSTKSTLDLCRTLIRTPSQASVDSTKGVTSVVEGWLSSNDVPYKALKSRTGRIVGILINPPDETGSNVLLLNACLDTALAGDAAQWSCDPFEAEESNGWLYGRGAADSKAAVAVFCSLGASLRTMGLLSRRHTGRHVSIFFDCDEHSGRFAGIKRFVQLYGYPANCIIGYPGNDKIVIGSRGFFRTSITLRGTLAHAGSGKPLRESAVEKLALLIQNINQFQEADRVITEEFPLAPKGSVTHISTGPKTFTVSASRIETSIDIRLTPTFGAKEAREHLRSVLARIEGEIGRQFPPLLSEVNTWPAFRTSEDCLLVQLLDESIQAILGRSASHQVSGPSNIGNLLAASGANVIAGFGVTYRDIHAPNECIEVASLEPICDVYSNLVSRYLGTPSEI
jgi:succinyl-diaminopimelate desuccinylase